MVSSPNHHHSLRGRQASVNRDQLFLLAVLLGIAVGAFFAVTRNTLVRSGAGSGAGDWIAAGGDLALRRETILAAAQAWTNEVRAVQARPRRLESATRFQQKSST